MLTHIKINLFLFMITGAVMSLFSCHHVAPTAEEPVEVRTPVTVVPITFKSITSSVKLPATAKLQNLYLYGGLFDIIAVALGHLVPIDPYDLRHILCASIGIGGIGAAAATARLIAGPRAALIAAVAPERHAARGTAPCSTTPRTFPSPRL